MPLSIPHAIRLFALLLPLVVCAPALPAQQPTPPILTPAAPGKTQRLTLKDGSQLVGRILSVDSTSVRFESSLGVTTIAIDSIVSARDEAPGQVHQGRYYFRNPNATRLVFAPTGRMLPKGEGYFSDFWVFFPGFATGLSNMFTLGGGMSILPGVDIDKQVYFVTPKIGIVQRDRFNAAVGALAVAVPNIDDNGGNNRTSAGLLYGVSTWGSYDQSFTAGLGYGYIGGTLARSPVVLLGGETRASPRISLVTENYIFPGGTGVISAAVRFMSQDIAVDLGLAHPLGFGSGEVTLPVLNFMWKW